MKSFEESGAFGHYTMRNLRADRFLSDAAAEDFSTVLLGHYATNDPDALRVDYLKTCYSHGLCGGEVGLAPYPLLLGRACDRSAFYNMMVRVNGVSRLTVERLLRDLERGRLTPTRQRTLRSMKMSAYPVWITWDRPSGGMNPPFSFLRSNSSYDLRCALGLPIDASVVSRRPVITFEYKSVYVSYLFRPTTADAASFTRFAVRQPPPPPDSDWFGLTVPWQDDPDNRLGGKSGYPPKLPEALHEPIRFPPDVKCETYYHMHKALP
ncbi:MAG: hypothetical protein QOJ91_276 [Sphingomonadales bacterium]|nr:hypothetical protein [Sphingomonadales bacterium]